MTANRFDRLLPLAGALIGLLFFIGLALTWGDPSSETAPAETFSYWHDNGANTRSPASYSRH